MAELTAKKIVRQVNSKDDNIGILGLSFKPDSDDVRDSPAARIINSLRKEGYNNIYAFDPLAINEFKNVYDISVNYSESVHELCEKCGTVALITAWDEFIGIDNAFPNTHFIDCRYFLDKWLSNNLE